ncbi:hypothetical protein BST28156_05420 [Burkholderia stagnalis]|nr:hypothetical protein BST28156_05420 [Burkholderia stagnalis]
MPPWPLFIVQLRIRWRFAGPYSVSRSLPDLIAIQSSPVLNVQPSHSTSVQASGSKPSLFGPMLSAVTPRITTLRHAAGWCCQNGVFCVW